LQRKKGEEQIDRKAGREKRRARQEQRGTRMREKEGGGEGGGLLSPARGCMRRAFLWKI